MGAAAIAAVAVMAVSPPPAMAEARDPEDVKKEALVRMTGVYAGLFAITGAGAVWSAVKGEDAPAPKAEKQKAAINGLFGGSAPAPKPKAKARRSVFGK